jgi:hypothetical protein
MKTAIVLILIVAVMAGSYFVNKWLQKIIKPRQTLGRLMLYMLAVLIVVFLFSFFMVLIIIRLYPDELIT